MKNITAEDEKPISSHVKPMTTAQHQPAEREQPSPSARNWHLHEKVPAQGTPHLL